MVDRFGRIFNLGCSEKSNGFLELFKKLEECLREYLCAANCVVRVICVVNCIHFKIFYVSIISIPSLRGESLF